MIIDDNMMIHSMMMYDVIVYHLFGLVILLGLKFKAFRRSGGASSYR